MKTQSPISFFAMLFATLVMLAIPGVRLGAAEAAKLFERDNLVAWCIVPFDGKQRTPEQRADMLGRLGIKHFAYDHRPQHHPTFERELLALKKHGIDLLSIISPSPQMLALLEKHNLKPQVWAVFPAAPASVTVFEERVKFSVDGILPLVEKTRQMGCQLGLYGHGGWSGHPDNMVAVAKCLREEHGAGHVGIVYNLHWAHNVLDRFPSVLEILKPYLICLNLNGMTKNGPAVGKMILPLAQGELDLTLLTQIRDSGYAGPIGILNHSNEDAELRLQDNLDGLNWLAAQLEGKSVGLRPKPRSWMEPAEVSARIFAHSNLAAGHTAPLDGAKQGSDEQAAMLEKTGIGKCVVDGRSGNTAQWNAQLGALKRHQIGLLAWRFPPALNADAKAALELFKQHGVKPQLWVGGSGGPVQVKDAADQKARLQGEVERLLPIANAAAEVGCTVGLSNEGDWYGEPENALAIVEALKEQGVLNVGIVYNIHHGPPHLARLVGIFARTLPHLLCVNLNAAGTGGDAQGSEPLPLGAGPEDLHVLHILRESAYRGPVGLLNSTGADVEARMLDDLDGLHWLVQKLDGKSPGPMPKYRTHSGQ
jgi:hypothetical protein